MLQVNAMGRFVDDPTIKTVKSNDNEYLCCNFRLACRHNKSETTFINVTAWRELAKHIYENTSKGDRIYVYGRLKIDDYVDKPTGKRKQNVYIVVDKFEFCGNKSVKKQPTINEENESKNQTNYVDDYDEIIS